MRRNRGNRHGGSDPLAGWPTGRYSPITPAGEYEQLDKLLSGMPRQKGWRRVAASLAAVVVLLIIAAVIIAGVIHLVG